MTFSALALAAVLTASPAANTTSSPAAPPAAWAGQAATPRPSGLPIPAVVEWLKAQGLEVGPLHEGATPYLQVRENQNLTWTLTFNGCEGQVCGDVQFGAGFANETVTPELVNRWNAERRFLKAFYEGPTAGRATGAAILQYDVILMQDAQVAQLADHLAVWREMLPVFALHVGYFVQDGQTSPAA